MHRRAPFVMGYDVVGEIDQLGDGVRGFQFGDRVADMTVTGSNTAYRTLRADRLARVPAGLDAAEAATLILSWTTAYQLLIGPARVQRGQRVLVHGAAGAVGQALLALGRLAGFEVWGTARGERAALIRELGATPIDYQREDFTRVLPSGFDAVFDGIGQDGYGRSFTALKRGGVLCIYGYTARAQRHRRLVTLLMWLAAPISRVSVEVAAQRQARPHLLHQRDPGATSRLVQGGPGAALWPVGNPRHSAARRRATPSMRSPRHTADSRRAVSRAGSSCVRISRRYETGCRLRASPASLESGQAGTLVGRHRYGHFPCARRHPRVRDRPDRRLRQATGLSPRL